MRLPPPFSLAPVLALILLAGCDRLLPPGGSGQPQVLVVDLNAVASGVGRLEPMQEEVEGATRQLQQRLSQLASEARDELLAERARLGGDNPTPEQEQELARLAAEATQRVQQARQQASARTQQIRNEVAVRFRDEVRPAAERVAKRRGATAVLLLGNELLWHEPSSDITQEVIAEMKGGE